MCITSHFIKNLNFVQILYTAVMKNVSINVKSNDHGNYEERQLVQLLCKVN